MYIRYYKERDTDPMVFLQRFRCTTEPIGGGTEYDDEGELVSWDAAVAAIEIAMKQLGWHPASEMPPLDEKGYSDDLIVICGTGNAFSNLPRWSQVVEGIWGDNDVKWWCYPPKED